MKNITEILSELGITVPEDKHAALNKAVAENYKTIAEHEKRVNRLTEDLTAEKNRADTAVDALKGFDGLDAASIKKQLEEANRKVQEAQQAAEQQLAERDFNDALKTELDGIKFTSAAARKSVETDIRAAGLKLKNGKILGLSDLVEQLKKDDASAFVDEAAEQLQNGAARFTAPKNADGSGAGGTITVKDIMKIKDPVERQRLIGQNMNLFRKE